MKNTNLLFLIILFVITPVLEHSCSENTSNAGFKVYTDNELADIYKDIDVTFDSLDVKVVQPAEGYLKYPYLIPAGFYKQMWDWDGFFIANYFVTRGKPEYLKYWAMNLLEGVDEHGYVSGCATIKGPRQVFGTFAMKPFLSQGVYLNCKATGDYSWVPKYYEKLKLVLSYREKTQQDSISGLFYWEDAMQSGGDNNPALNYFKQDPRKFLACDASAYQYREYLAQSLIAKHLGKKEDAKIFSDKAAKLKNAINTILWSKEDKMYYNKEIGASKLYKRVSYSCFVPLFAGLANQRNGRAMIKEHLLNPDEMKSKYGYRSLSAKDPDYNNKNIIIPFSNCQGPVWPLANFLYTVALKNYGFDSELRWIAGTLGSRLVRDVKEYGSMHEAYSAETGESLSPDDTYVDENGRFIGFISWNLCFYDVLKGVVEDKWMDLDIK